MSKELIIGIDLGNSNCSLSYRTLDKSESKMAALEGSANVMPSVVLFPFKGGSPLVGKAAWGDTPGILFQNFKDRLMESAEFDPVEEKGISKTPQDALVEILHSLAERAFKNGDLTPYFDVKPVAGQEQYVPKRPMILTLGVPTEAPQSYKNCLYAAFVTAGWFNSLESARDYITFVREPVAAAMNFKPGEKRQFFIYDHGGLTLDMVSLELDEKEVPPYRITLNHPRVLYGTNDVGGSYIDRVLLHFLVKKAGGLDEIKSDIEEAYVKELSATQLGRLSKIVDKKAPTDSSNAESTVYAHLCRDVGRLRVSLSERQSGTFTLGSELAPVRTKVALTKADMEEALSDVFATIQKALPTADVGSQHCIMVGGCSLTPRLEGILKEHFGEKRVTVAAAPMEAVALGLSKYYQTSIDRVDGDMGVIELIDTDFGVWDGGERVWDVILKEGTPYKNAVLPSKGIPPEGRGFYQTYQPHLPTTEIRVRVAQRNRKAEAGGIEGGWVELGERTVRLPTAATRFRIYFGMPSPNDPLELRLADIRTREVITMKDPTFKF